MFYISVTFNAEKGREIARTLPGDELLSNPTVTMTHGISIEVPPAEVWPWIAQIGDIRGGFYGYTWLGYAGGSRL